MPIASPLSSNPIKQEEFAQLDYVVMRHAFECQNQLGRSCVTNVPLLRGKVGLGKQRFFLLNGETAFRVTALTDDTEEYERHLRCLLCLSPLRAIQWINLARNQVRLVSLIK